MLVPDHCCARFAGTCAARHEMASVAEAMLGGTKQAAQHTCGAYDVLPIVHEGDLHKGVRAVQQLQSLLQLRNLCWPCRLHSNAHYGRRLQHTMPATQQCVEKIGKQNNTWTKASAYDQLSREMSWDGMSKWPSASNRGLCCAENSIPTSLNSC
jgi:hypothetical protein